MRLLLPLAFASTALTGCGVASPACTLTDTLIISPLAATANHAAAAPGNQIQFFSEIAPKPSAANCPVPQFVIAARPDWTNPDPLDITISSAADATNGTAVCSSATPGPVSLTASVGTQATPSTITVQLTCQ
jgi:hypothetical protein